MQDILKLEKIFKMLGSQHDGEILSAVYAMKTNLLAQNKTITDLGNFLFQKSNSEFERFYQRKRPKYDKPSNQSSRHDNPGTKEHKRMAEHLINMPQLMTNWESTFVKDIVEKNISKMKSLSDKQAACLEKIYKFYSAKEKTV